MVLRSMMTCTLYIAIAELSDYTSAVCNYIQPFSARIEKKLLCHPISTEKSADIGSRITKLFSTMRIIPAIDIIDGKCVRLTKGLYHQKDLQ